MGFFTPVLTKYNEKKTEQKASVDIPFVFPNMSTGGATTPQTRGVPEFTGFQVPAPEGQAPKVLENTTISQGVPDKPQGFFAPVFEGLFGKKDAASQLGEDKGLVGFLAPFMSKTETEKVMPLYQSLVDKGVDTKRATDLAVKATRGETGALSEDLSWGERKAIALAQAKNSAGIALDIASNIPGVGVMGKLGNKADDAFRIIAKSQDVGEITRALEKVVPDVADNTLAKQLVDVTDKREVKQIVDDAIATRAEQLAEARKYKTVEEYKQAQGTPVYRGGETLDKTKVTDEGVSVATTKDVADRFATRNKGTTQEFFISPNAKILDASELTPSKIRGDLTLENVIKFAKTEGYDAIDYTKGLVNDPKIGGSYLPENEIRIVNPDVLKTPQDLTNIYTKAHEVPFRKGTSEAFQQADAEVVTEMLDLSEAGYRVVLPHDATRAGESVIGVSSTFPDWVPSELRSRDLFDKAVQHYEAGTRPAANATNVNRLIDVMQNEVKERAVKYGDTEIATALPTQTRMEAGTGQSVAQETAGISKATKESDQKLRDTLSSSKSVPEKMKAVFTNFVEYFQNSQKRVLSLVENKNLNTATNPYEIMALYHGRLGTKIERGYAKAEEIADDIVISTGRKEASVEEGRTAVNKYLQAQHAPERNKALGDGAAGMTNEEAAKIVAETPQEIKDIAEKALALNRETLDMLHEAGVITDELYDGLRTKYKNHVPLQRVMDEAEDVGTVLSARGFDVRGTGVRTAKGSERDVLDILGNIINNYEQGVIRSEKNIVDRATLSFVRNNADDLAHIMEVKKPHARGVDFRGKPIMEQTQDPTILQLYENGKPIWIQFHDPKLAIAFRGVGKEKVGAFLNAVGAFTRFYAGLATRFNPEFVLPNKIRDLQETMTYLGAQGDIGFKGAAKTALRDPASIKAVADGLRGADTAGARLYAEMKALGGTTGGMGLSTRKQTQLNLDKIFDTARSRPRQAAQKLVEYVDNWNTIFEDSTRLSVYKTALESGATKERAAFLAKEASINFNRAGNGGPVINALWMFANASIQGSAKMMRAMRNPKVAAGVVTSVGGSVAAVSEWNDSIDPEWRDKVTKWDRNNGLPVMLPSEDGKSRYFVIPVSWGIKPILTMSNAAYDALSGVEVDPIKATGDVLSSFIDAYNPIGGTNLASAIIPTIGDVPAEIWANQSWSGAPIRPTPYNNEPKDIQYFQTLKDTAQGRGAIATTKKLQESTGMAISPADVNYVIDQYIGGAGRSIKKTSELLYGITTDAPTPPADEWPFVSRFFRERTQEEIGRGAGGDTEKLVETLSDQARERFQVSEEAKSTYETLKTLPKDVAANRFNDLAETNPELAKKIVEEANDEKKGLTYKDRLVKSLGVDNGERALYLKAQFDKQPTKDGKAKLWKELMDKGLISDDVSTQLNSLFNQ